MTGLHDKRVTRESRRSSLKRPRPAAAAPPPAHRTKHAEVPAPPRKRERSAPAARAARSLLLPDGERDPEDAAPAPPPPPPKRPRSVPSNGDRDPTDAAVAPPPRAAEAPVPRPHSAYALRNRDVPGTSDRHATGGTSNRKPCIPARKEKREELKHDRPFSSRNKPKQPEPWEAISCARMGLEHYNSMNQGDEHELVKAVDANSFIWCGGWLHANFLARPKGANSCVDLAPKYLFAELNLNASGLSCASCVKMDSVQPKDLGHCGVCPGKIMHPAAGVYLAKDRTAADDDPPGVYLAKDSAAAADDDLEMAAFDFL